MRKTFCDKCGAECVNGSDRVYIEREHTTSQGEELGSDCTHSTELCFTCGDVARQVLGVKPATDTLLIDDDGTPHAVTNPHLAHRMR